MNPSLTLSALIAQSAQQLDAAHTTGNLSFGHGTTERRDEAAWLVLWKLGLPLDTDVSDPTHNIELPAAQVASVKAFIEHRIASRKPAAYLTQEAWLQGGVRSTSTNVPCAAFTHRRGLGRRQHRPLA